ncbi:MAG: MerR family transcriptional regulator [Nanoarchaeota archaeon]
MKHVSLGELAIKLGINKSKLAYFYSIGLLKSISKVGKTNVFDGEKTLKIIKKIGEFKKQGKTLKDIKELLK